MAVARAERIRKRFAAAVAATGSPLANAETQDISETGLALQTDRKYPVGAELRVVVRPADQLPLELRGQVIWSADGTMGLRLLGPQRRYLEVVARSVASEQARVSRASSSPELPRLPMPDPALVERKAREATLPPEFRSGIRSRAPAPVTTPPPPKLPPMTPMAPMPGPVRAPWVPAPERPNEVRFQSTGPTPELPGLPELSETTPVDLRLPGRQDARPPRFDERLPVRVGLQPDKLDRRGILLNISSTGVSMQCAGTFHKGARVAIAITLPEETLARIDGTVAWSHPADEPKESVVGVRLLRTDSPFLQLVSEVRQRE